MELIDFSKRYGVHGIPDITIKVIPCDLSERDHVEKRKKIEGGSKEPKESKGSEEKIILEDDEMVLEEEVKSVTFYFSKMLLWKTSDYFKAVFTCGGSAPVEVTIHAPISEFNLVLNYIYHGTLMGLDEENALSMYLLFDRFLIHSKLQEIAEYMYQNMNPWELCRIASRYEIEHIKSMINGDIWNFLDRLRATIDPSVENAKSILCVMPEIRHNYVIILDMISHLIDVTEIVKIANIYCRHLLAGAERSTPSHVSDKVRMMNVCFRIVHYSNDNILKLNVLSILYMLRNNLCCAEHMEGTVPVLQQ